MKLFIGCSSSNEIDKHYFDESYSFLKEILKDNDLVYGAYNNGIMRIAYDLAQQYNRNIIAITTDKYKDDLKDLKCTYYEVKYNIFGRSEELIAKSDMVIILPGGIGTITEFMTALETMRNQEFNKPILMYNINGFFDKLLSFLDQIYNEKFTSFEVSKNYFVANTKEDALKYIRNFKEE